MKSWDLNSQQRLRYIHLRPIMGGRVMVEPVQHIRRQTRLQQSRILPIWRTQRLDAEVDPSCLQRVAGLDQLQASRILFEHLQAPAQARRQPERPVMVEPAVIEVMRRHPRRDADQTLRLLRGGQQLRHPLVGKTIHANLAVRLRATAQPADRLRAINPLVPKRIELALRIAPPAHVLDHHVVAVAREPRRVRIHHRGRDVPAVGLPHQ